MEDIIRKIPVSTGLNFEIHFDPAAYLLNEDDLKNLQVEAENLSNRTCIVNIDNGGDGIISVFVNMTTATSQLADEVSGVICRAIRACGVVTFPYA